MDETLRLNRDDQKTVDHIAQRQCFSPDAGASMLEALARGAGSMAQFNHPEFGGSGQWIRGGMTMVSDLFNHRLKARVDALCTELAELLARRPELLARAAPGEGSWWPRELGVPDSAGAQNGRRYAYFAAQRRLALSDGARVTVHDTLDHRISGVSQQQSSGSHVVFTSQDGPVDIGRLPEVWSNTPRNSVPDKAREERAPRNPARPTSTQGSGSTDGIGQGGHAAPRRDDTIALIERLAELRAKDILTDEEFQAKKAELLARL